MYIKNKYFPASSHFCTHAYLQICTYFGTYFYKSAYIYKSMYRHTVTLTYIDHFFSLHVSVHTYTHTCINLINSSTHHHQGLLPSITVVNPRCQSYVHTYTHTLNKFMYKSPTGLAALHNCSEPLQGCGRASCAHWGRGFCNLGELNAALAGELCQEPSGECQPC